MEQGFVTGGRSQLDRRVVKAGNLFGEEANAGYV